MGSRLRPLPEKIFECLIEVSAPLSENEGAKLIKIFPENYEEFDMIKDAVPNFCFPFAHDAEMVDAVQHFAFVLTDIEGLFRFGFCRYPPKAKTCLCILSDLPAFEMFYGILNTLAELENSSRNEGLTSKQFLDLVLESNIPEPGTKFTVSDPGSGWMRQYNYPDPEKLPTIPENRNLTDYFSAVNPNNMIALFASMMFERRIIVTSKKLSLLTACTYSASLLLYPMHWQHVFIPVMPPSILDYCSAPMPFLFGVHSSLMEKVRDMPLDDVVILDVDRNEIEVGFDDINDLPSEAVSKLNNALKKTTIAVGDYVARAFLSAIVVLIGGYRDALKLSNDKIVFEDDLFVNSRPHMKPFLENLLKLQLFERFVHHRLEQLNSGEAIDDIFEEQVGLQTESDSKWVSQYKQWVKNRKRDGTQLFNKFSGKTEKATYKAKKFIHAGVKNVKLHGKNGWREAMKGIREKGKNFIENNKGTDKELACYDNTVTPNRSNSLPMKRLYAVQPDPRFSSRNSIGSVLHNRVSPPPSPTKSPRPSRPPPKVPTDPSPSSGPPRPPPPRPTNPPPRRPRPPSLPPPYQSPSGAGSNPPPPPLETEKADPPPVNGSGQLRSRKGSPSLKLRPSMLRDPGEPGVQDLINFYDSGEDLTSSTSRSNVNDPFANFQEFDYLSDRSEAESQTELKASDLSLSEGNLQEGEGFFDQTMIALSDDTRHFLRNSRLFRESSENAKKCENSNPSLDSEPLESPRLKRQSHLKRIRPEKKTLREIALEQKTGNGHIPLAHASSAPSLLDLLTDNMENLHHSSSSADITSSRGVTSSSGKTSSVTFESNTNVGQLGFVDSRTDNGDPFLELISRRHKPLGRVTTGQ